MNALIVARIKKVYRNTIGPAHYELEPLAEADAIKFCVKHPRAVWHGEEECPSCKAEIEFLQLTKDMERR